MKNTFFLNKKITILATLTLALGAIIPAMTFAAGPSATPPGGNVDAHFNTVGTSKIYNGADPSSAATGDVDINDGLRVSKLGDVSNPKMIDVTPGSPDILYSASDETNCRSRGGSVFGPLEGGISICLYPSKMSDEEGVVLGNEGLFILPPDIFGSPMILNNTTQPLIIGQFNPVTPAGISIDGPIKLNGLTISSTDSTRTTKIGGSDLYYQIGDYFQVDFNGDITNPLPAQPLRISDPDGVYFDSTTKIDTRGDININKNLATPSSANQPFIVNMTGGQGGVSNSAATISTSGDTGAKAINVSSDGTAVYARGNAPVSSVAVDAYAHGNGVKLGSPNGAVEITDGTDTNLLITSNGNISNPGGGIPVQIADNFLVNGDGTKFSSGYDVGTPYAYIATGLDGLTDKRFGALYSNGALYSTGGVMNSVANEGFTLNAIPVGGMTLNSCADHTYAPGTFNCKTIKGSAGLTINSETGGETINAASGGGLIINAPSGGIFLNGTASITNQTPAFPVQIKDNLLVTGNGDFTGSLVTGGHIKATGGIGTFITPAVGFGDHASPPAPAVNYGNVACPVKTYLVGCGVGSTPSKAFVSELKIVDPDSNSCGAFVYSNGGGVPSGFVVQARCFNPAG